MEKQHLIDIAAKKKKAAVVFKDVAVIDVYSRETIRTDVAIDAGYIVAIGDGYEGETEYHDPSWTLAPSFIDSHVHIESSMVPPHEFAKAVLPLGVTTVIADPHEIANVNGALGIEYMLADAEGLPLDVRMMLPSCVPATPFEHAGAKLYAEDLAPFLGDPGVHGLGEVMDYPSVESGSPDMLQKIAQTELAGKVVDGHASGLGPDQLNVYRTAGIMTDHECTTAEEALERVRRGFYVQIREGSVARNVEQVSLAITESNAHRFLFCTDDKHLDDLVAEGGIDYNIRMAIKQGVKPETAYAVASLHAAEAYGLKEVGAIAPGKRANFVILSDVQSVKIETVYVNGEVVAKAGKATFEADGIEVPKPMKGELKLPDLTAESFRLAVKEEAVDVIQVLPNSLLTKRERLVFQPDASGADLTQDIATLAVIERHHGTGHMALAPVTGFGLKRGALAATVAHDSHNLVIAGVSPDDMLLAAETLEKVGGGVVAVSEGKVLAVLPLEIGGLMTKRPYAEVADVLEQLNDALDVVGAHRHFNPYLTMSFLALPVIPDLKLTDMGLFDVTTFSFIES
ncbi:MULTISPECIES: adenine deaminase [Exiguobacterium]|uniref:adenine deaminase n=1 Tax=Exiguobacterium TaxID=33986 RepID=UPI001BE5ED51|nr:MULTISPECIES: adenine deaminase [Exiguobacterium]MCT4776735.1 adenine deaminase [Exiguobacterium aquaticum]MCT4790263.1 adenine deaminase [Exiguobacterium mexicanum]